MPSNNDKSGADNSSLKDDLEIFETLFREELDTLKPVEQEKALLRPDGDESKDSSGKVGNMEKSGDRSHPLRILFLVFLFIALGAFSINYLGILDLSKFMPFSRQTQKAMVPPRAVNKSPVGADKKGARPAGKSFHPETTVEKPIGPGEALESSASAERAGPEETPPKTASPKKTARGGKPSRPTARVYPYSVYLGSYRTTEGLQNAASVYRKMGLTPYWVKVDLEEMGIWFRVYTGFFKTRKEADEFIKENHIPGAATKHTRYTVLVGTYKSEEKVNTKKRELRAVGCCPYGVKDSKGACRLCTGAFYQMARAQKHKAKLATHGIQGQVVER